MTLVFVLTTALSLSAKCDWNTLKLKQWNERNYYKWQVSGQVLDDTCVDYTFMVYDFQTKKTDTVYDVRGIVEVQFNVKGKYNNKRPITFLSKIHWYSLVIDLSQWSPDGKISW